MTSAYSELYLSSARSVFASMLDYVANTLNIDLTDFMHQFMVKGYAEQWEKGNPKFINGYSGIELAQNVLSRDVNSCEVLGRFKKPIFSNNRSKEFWCGNVLAYYQWLRDKSFKRILNKLPINAILDMYYTLHEADISKFVQVADKMLVDNQTRLAIVRKIVGISQIELSKQSGVSLVCIRAYEQKTKDINKARVDSVIKLTKVLHCNIEDILD